MMRRIAKISDDYRQANYRHTAMRDGSCVTMKQISVPLSEIVVFCVLIKCYFIVNSRIQRPLRPISVSLCGVM